MALDAESPLSSRAIPISDLDRAVPGCGDAHGVPVVEELPEKSVGAWHAFERVRTLPHVLFFDSALKHPELGRWSFVTADPFEWWTSRRKRVYRNGTEPQGEDPFAVLAARLASFPAPRVPGLPPFQGGAAGLFGYDLCHHLERLPRPRVDEFAVPDLAIGLYDWVVAFDHGKRRSWIISTGFPALDPRLRRERAEKRLSGVRKLVTRGIPPPIMRPGEIFEPYYCVPVPGRSRLCSNFTRDAYLSAIRRAIEYVHAGDCFQVNVSQRLLHAAPADPVVLYRRLRERNAATFAGYFDLGDFVIASASPERFLRVEGGKVETRPIKGTPPRSADPVEDERRRHELLQSAKDRAENIMIVDLLRNDLGRVCRYGSVDVAALCRTESYRHVHHLVSVVRGQLRDDCTPVDLLRAAFPGGSVTGAPEIRAMEIIAELEPTARGPYCGSLGYLGFDGSMDTNVLIRTFTIGRGWAQFPVGGGIVADSVPVQEYEETWHKAEGLVRALRP